MPSSLDYDQKHQIKKDRRIKNSLTINCTKINAKTCLSFMRIIGETIPGMAPPHSTKSAKYFRSDHCTNDS